MSVNNHLKKKRKVKIRPKLNIFFLLMLVISLLIFNSCARKIYEVTYPTLIDGKYDSEFPYRSSSQQLEEIGTSVKMLSVIAFYKNYIIDPQISANRNQILSNLEKYAIETIHYNTTASGTATVIYYHNRQVALLTCAHIVDFPDTVTTYYSSDSEVIKSIAVKDHQINYITDLPEGSDIEIVFMDTEIDVAVMGKKLSVEPEFRISVFRYPLGKARELEWGSFVYLLGYPIGHKMITKGIVSSPKMDNNTAFMIDAPFNRGSSGGIVLAIRDGIPNFELVGLANSVSANTNYLLAPSDENDYSRLDINIPYEGQLFLRQQENIRYGITHIIAIEAIIKTLKKNHKKLLAQGYDFSTILD